ncbi:MAG: hypothetical protein NT051_03660 [Candidatus Micrarchaeota archaeon]|nr:hypothetical protein [Candidatus Micrarchaeota archaeon]
MSLIYRPKKVNVYQEKGALSNGIYLNGKCDSHYSHIFQAYRLFRKGDSPNEKERRVIVYENTAFLMSGKGIVRKGDSLFCERGQIELKVKPELESIMKEPSKGVILYLKEGTRNCEDIDPKNHRVVIYDYEIIKEVNNIPESNRNILLCKIGPGFDTLNVLNLQNRGGKLNLAQFSRLRSDEKQVIYTREEGGIYPVEIVLQADGKYKFTLVALCGALEPRSLVVYNQEGAKGIYIAREGPVTPINYIADEKRAKQIDRAQMSEN